MEAALDRLEEESKQLSNPNSSHGGDDYGDEDDDFPDDFAEQYRKKQEAMLAELKSIYDVKTEWSQQLSQIADLNNHKDTTSDEEDKEEVLDPEAQSEMHKKHQQDLKTIMNNL